MRVSGEVERNPSDVRGETRIVSKLNASQSLNCPFCPARCHIAIRCYARHEQLLSLNACCVLSVTVSLGRSGQ